MRAQLWAVVAVVLFVGCGGGDRVVTVGPAQLPAANVGQPFEVALTASAPDATVSPLNVSVTKGSLPPGIATYQTPGNGTGTSGLRGTPTTAGSYTFTLELAGYCTMGGCTRGSRDYTLVVNPAPTT